MNYKRHVRKILHEHNKLTIKEKKYSAKAITAAIKMMRNVNDIIPRHDIYIRPAKNSALPFKIKRILKKEDNNGQYIVVIATVQNVETLCKVAELTGYNPNAEHQFTLDSYSITPESVLSVISEIYAHSSFASKKRLAD